MDNMPSIKLLSEMGVGEGRDERTEREANRKHDQRRISSSICPEILWWPCCLQKCFWLLQWELVMVKLIQTLCHDMQMTDRRQIECVAVINMLLNDSLEFILFANQVFSEWMCKLFCLFLPKCWICHCSVCTSLATLLPLDQSHKMSAFTTF